VQRWCGRARGVELRRRSHGSYIRTVARTRVRVTWSAGLVRPAAQHRLGCCVHHARVSMTAAEPMVASRTRDHERLVPSALATRYNTVRAYTETLAAPLSAEDQTIQSMPDVSPTKWHRAHTTWFFETFVLPRGPARYEAFDPAYAYLFNSYYETVGARHPRPQRGLLSRPGITDIARYRAYVDAAMLDALPDFDGSSLELVDLGLHHEQQHQELLLMDIKHVLSMNPLRPAYGDEVGLHTMARDLGWVAHDGGVVEIGHADDTFAFDNESPRHRVYL